MDNTLYQDDLYGAVSDASGQYITVGKNGSRRDGDDDRDLIQFDLSKIPAGSTILSATLSLYLAATKDPSTQRVSVYPMVMSWQDAVLPSGQTADSSAQSGTYEGGGDPPVDGDPTWQDQSYNSGASPDRARSGPGAGAARLGRAATRNRG